MLHGTSQSRYLLLPKKILESTLPVAFIIIICGKIFEKMRIILLNICFISLLLISCDNTPIKNERNRLSNIEQKLTESLSKGDTNTARIYCLQLTWNYAAKTVGGASESNRYKEIWTEKRESYMRFLNMEIYKEELNSDDTLDSVTILEAVQELLD